MLFSFKRAMALTLLALSFSFLPVLTEQTSSTAVAQEKMPNRYRNLPWQYGTKTPKTVQLCDVLNFTLPRGFAILHFQGTQQLNRLTENPQTNECATIAASDMTWFAMLDYDRIGYVSDNGKVDADKLMESIKEGLAVGNRARARSGWAPLEMVGWIQKPKYDVNVNQLVWSTRLVSDGHESVNYETRLLGREGVIEVILVYAPEDEQRAIKEFTQLLKGLSFVSGKRYRDFKPGDKRAKETLADLIVGR